MLVRPAKLPLETSFAWLCGFIGTLRDGIVLLSQGKHDVNAAVPFTIPDDGWGTDQTVPSYPFYIDISVPGLLSSDVVAVDTAPESAAVARAANFTTTQSYNGKFRLRAEKVPEADIFAQYHVTNTVDYQTEQEE